MRVALDTNVLVSAAIADGPPRRVLELIAESDLELILPELVFHELRRVFREKLGLAEESVAELFALIEALDPEVVPMPERVDAVSGDPADDLILAAAVAAGADVLVSGDAKHLLPLGLHRDMRIIRPQQLLAELAR